MSPSLAFFLCSLFVVYLLYIDKKQSPNVTIASWLPTIWVLIISSRPLGAWVLSSNGNLNVESGSPKDMFVLITITLLTTIVLFKRRFYWIQAFKNNPWLFILIIYMLLSIFWSNIPFLSFKRWVRVLPVIIMAFFITSEPDPYKTMESIFRRTVFVLIPYSLILIKYFPDFGRAYFPWTGELMWVGVTTQKNSLGRLCFISAFFQLWAFYRRWKDNKESIWKLHTLVDIFLLCLTGYLLKGPGIQAYSATSVACLGIGIIAFLSLLSIKKYHIKIGYNIWIFLFASIMLIGIITPFVGGSTVGAFTSTLGRDATLTGRTDIWEYLVPLAKKHLILGCGFGGFWTSEIIDRLKVSEAHNGYLDVILQLGFVGLFITAMFIITSCQRAQKELVNNFDWAALLICYSLMCVISNISESSIHYLPQQLMTTIIFLSIICTAHQNRVADSLNYDNNNKVENYTNA